MEENNEKKLGKKINLVPILIGFALLACISFIGVLFFVRKRIYKKQDVSLSQMTSKVSERFKQEDDKRHAVLDTIGRLWGNRFEKASMEKDVTEELKRQYGIIDFGILYSDNRYRDSSGETTMPGKNGSESFFGISNYEIGQIVSGAHVILRSGTDVGGIVMGIPYEAEDDKNAILIAKYREDSLAEGVFLQEDTIAGTVIDLKGEILVKNSAFSELVKSVSWDDFFKNEIMGNESEIEEALNDGRNFTGSCKNASGNSVCYAVSRAEGMKRTYTVCLAKRQALNEELTAFMLAMIVIFEIVFFVLIGLLVYAVLMYIKNRRALYRAAYVDPLTGLPSKTKHKLDAQEMIDSENEKYSYVVFDIDKFKFVNEVFGYEYGNQLLVHISEVMKKETKKGEICSRVSGDNFAMVLHCEEEDELLCRRLSDMFDRIRQADGNKQNYESVRFSCGVFNVDEKMDINKVRANANLAREESKKQVFQEITFYNEVLKTKHVQERELEYDAAEALKNGEFVVYVQPKYEVDSERIAGGEALIRWNHSQKGMLSPISFIPLFEANGFIVPIDMYVLEKVCELISRWLRDGIRPVCISVNLSRTHLYEQNLVEKLSAVAKKYNVPPKYIEFELTESAIYEDMSNLLGVMEKIKNEGFRLSMDDFGSGYSSLNLLRHLPVDVLKLDKDFLDISEENDEGSREKRIITHVISMAKDLEMEVLAEGVETKEQKDFLKEAKCDVIQGYYYAKPMRMNEFEELYILEKFA